MQHTLERRCIFVFGDGTDDSECADAAFFQGRQNFELP